MRAAATLPLLLVLTACGGSDTDPDPGKFLVRSIDPSSGPEAGDARVAIGGSGFLIGIDEVRFDGRRATEIEVTSDGSLNCRTPANAAGFVDVEVVTIQGESAVLENGYEYRSPPRVVAVVPAAGAAGLTVSVVGLHFDDGSGRPPTVLFGDQESALPQMVNSTLLFATVPGGQPGPGFVDVTVINELGDGTLRNGFAYVSAALGGPPPSAAELLQEGYQLLETVLSAEELFLAGFDLPTREQVLGVFRDALGAR